MSLRGSSLAATGTIARNRKKAHSHYCPVAGFLSLDNRRSRRIVCLTVLERTATMRSLTIRLLASLLIAPLTFWLVPAGAALAQEKDRREDRPTPLQIVALDECDPATFNAVLGPDFCKNVALAFV